MSRIPQSFIDDLLNRLDIVEIIDHRVKLRKSGKNYSACCPFHEEKTPSFSVSPDKQFYYCFGCGATGNAVGFLMEYERQSFVDAIETLARTAGMEVPREQQSEKQIEKESRSKALYRTLEQASDWYQKQLREHPHKHKAVQYLKNRGLSGHIAKQFGLGYAPPGWDNLLLNIGNQEDGRELLVESGLAIHKPEENKIYDRFRDRITFPIKDARGRVIGFGGRVLTNEKPKYLNSPETAVFHKGRELYGLYETRQSQRNLENLVVVEGYMDVIALAQYGIGNAVATLGTACGEDHLQLAFRYVSEVIFCFDGDAAGRTAAKRALLAAIPAMEDGRQVKFLFLPEGQDPDSLVRQIGADRFQAQLKASTPLEEFLFDVSAEGLDINSMEGRARFSKIAAPLLNQFPRGVFRELMFANLAKRTGLDTNTLLELTSEKIELVEAEQSDSDEQAIEENPNTQGEVTVPTPGTPLYSAVRLSAAKTATILLLDNLNLVEKLETQLERYPHADEETKQLYALMDYMQKRPNCNFNNVLGYWGGTYGLEAQQKLANLVANQFLGSAKTLNTYDPQRELEAVFRKLNELGKKPQIDGELSALKAIGFENLNDEQKNRLRELLSGTK